VSDLYPVKPHIAERAHIRGRQEYERLYRLSLDNPDWFWGEQAKAISWFHPWQNVLDADYEEVDFAWFSGGRLNASFNCVDRHLQTLGDRTAIMRSLFTEVLPDQLLARPDKAVFGGAFVGRWTRDFARDWQGDGVDHDLVDPEILRASWLAEKFDFRGALLLQAAWLHQQR